MFWKSIESKMNQMQKELVLLRKEKESLQNGFDNTRNEVKTLRGEKQTWMLEKDEFTNIQSKVNHYRYSWLEVFGFVFENGIVFFARERAFVYFKILQEDASEIAVPARYAECMNVFKSFFLNEAGLPEGLTIKCALNFLNWCVIFVLSSKCIKRWLIVSDKWSIPRRRLKSWRTRLITVARACGLNSWEKCLLPFKTCLKKPLKRN